jgi:superfamily II DNA or RNA helicase
MGNWRERIDLAFVDRRLGKETVDRWLRTKPKYDEPPRLDAASRMVAVLDGIRVAVRLVEPDDLEIACSCARGPRTVLCEHVAELLVDLALGGADRHAALVARTLDAGLARWLPSAPFDDDLAIDVESVRYAGVASPEERPAILLRHRRANMRALVPPREVLAARLRPRHRRLVELTAPSNVDRNALVATRGQATLLIHLLKSEMHVFTKSFSARLSFADEPVAPRIDRTDDALVVRWCLPDGTVLCDAATALLYTGATPYLWSEERRVFHPVAPTVDLDTAWAFHVTPSLPLTNETAAHAGRALLLRGRAFGVALPSAETFGLPEEAKPRFGLRLSGTPLEVRAELHLDGHAIEPGGAYDTFAEEAVTRLEAAGFVAEGSAWHASEERAIELWEHGIEPLRADFDVVLAASLAKVRVGPAAPIRVRVDVGEEAGWLDVKLHFSAKLLDVEMAAIRRSLKAKERWIALSDGTLARITEEVAALVDEASTLFDDAHGRLPPHQLGRIDRWLDRFGGEVDPPVATLRKRLRALAVSADPALPSSLATTLRPYQKEGLAWLQFLFAIGAGGIFADDMGLGKTVTTLAFLARVREDAGPAPVLVVCPTSIVGNWRREIERFTPELGEDIQITSYGMLLRDEAKLVKKRFRCVVLDEAQYIKNPNALTTRAARRLGADMRLALSGTPIENRLRELWSIMTFANPGLLGPADDFDERFERPITLRPDGAVAEHLRAIVRPFVLRRTKADVLVDLPPKTEIERRCILGIGQRRLYDALAIELRRAVKQDKQGRQGLNLGVLTAILRLRQMACDPRLVDPKADPHDSAKRHAFLDLVRRLVAEGRRALVFSQFVELFTLWREDLDRERVAYAYLDGATEKRDEVVDRFQRGDAPLFLVSLKAGGAGLNLTAADTVIHLDPWWNPAAEEQASGRAHRIGQERPVTVIRLVAEGTIEDKIALLKDAKRTLAASIMDASAGAPSGLDEADLDLLLGEVSGPDVEVDGEEEEETAGDVLSDLEIDELRTVVRRLDRRARSREELAGMLGLPVSRIGLLLVGHRVPISRRAAERIRALRI